MNSSRSMTLGTVSSGRIGSWSRGRLTENQGNLHQEPPRPHLVPPSVGVSRHFSTRKRLVCVLGKKSSAQWQRLEVVRCMSEDGRPVPRAIASLVRDHSSGCSDGPDKGRLVSQTPLDLQRGGISPP